MGSRNISISDEAYSKLKRLKGRNESFTDVINRLTNKTSILSLRGILSHDEAESTIKRIRESRNTSENRLNSISGKIDEK